MSSNPDEVIDHRPNFCKVCGEDLSQSVFSLESRRQEVVLPPIVPQYIEHRAYGCHCSKCGSENVADLAPHLKGNVQYHPNVSAIVGYLSVRQYVPYNRIAEMMGDVFNLHISEGTVDNMLISLTEKATPVYEEIQNRLMDSDMVGGDETLVRINGGKGWLFVFQNAVLTYLAVASSRGFASIEHLFKDGFPKAVYVTDCLAAQLKTSSMLHQICNDHLLRELNNFIDVFDCEWSKSLKALLKKALELKRGMTDEDYGMENEKVKTIETELTKILETNVEDKHKKIRAFEKRLIKNRNAILTYLYHPEVPPDNNGSERAIRNAKVKVKVSGQFKKLDGANRFAILRSVIDTAIKNNQNPIAALFAVANYFAV